MPSVRLGAELLPVSVCPATLVTLTSPADLSVLSIQVQPAGLDALERIRRLVLTLQSENIQNLLGYNYGGPVILKIIGNFKFNKM